MLSVPIVLRLRIMISVLAGFRETSDGTVYEFFDHETLNAADASAACEAKNGKLAVIQTMAEYNRLR